MSADYRNSSQLNFQLSEQHISLNFFFYRASNYILFHFSPSDLIREIKFLTSVLFGAVTPKNKSKKIKTNALKTQVFERLESYMKWLER